MAVKLGFTAGTQLHFSLQYQWVSFFRAPNAATAWRCGGPEYREKPAGRAIGANAGLFSGWRMESRARPQAAGHDRIRRAPPWITKQTQLPETKVTSNSYQRQGRREAPAIAKQRREVAGWKRGGQERRALADLAWKRAPIPFLSPCGRWTPGNAPPW